MSIACGGNPARRIEATVVLRSMLVVVLAIRILCGTAQARQFQSSDVESFEHPSVQAVAYMNELLRQRSGGRLGIGDLGASDPDSDSEIFTVAQLRTGTLDMARINVSALHAAAPAMVVPSLPFLFTSTEHRRRILDGPIGEELLTSLTPQGLVGLCFYDAGPRSIYTVSKPIRTAADMKGLRIRVQPSGAIVQMMQALGARPMPLPYGQVKSQLAAGMIDAAENNLTSYAASRHHETARTYSLTEHTAPPGIVVLSKRTWDQLPPNDQKIVRQAARDSASHFRKLLHDRETAARAMLDANSVRLVADVDKTSFIEILAPLYPKLVPDTRHRMLLERVQEGH